jgi:hypothetical protein
MFNAVGMIGVRMISLHITPILKLVMDARNKYLVSSRLPVYLSEFCNYTISQGNQISASLCLSLVVLGSPCSGSGN